jgi:tetratricopeptide (TPR) repeat protein
MQATPNRGRQIAGKPLIIGIVLTILGLGGFLIVQLLLNNQRLASLLVLPPKAPTNRPDLRWTGEAWADSLIFRLQHAGSLRVVSRETAWLLADRWQKPEKTEPREAAIDAQSVGVLFGEILPAGSGFVLKVKLMDARDNNVRWEKSFSASSATDAEQVFATWIQQQPDFAVMVAKEAKADFDDAAEKRMRQPMSSQPLAWKEWERAQNSSFSEAIGAIESSLVEDLGFAAAYVALATRQLDLGETLPDGAGDITAGLNMANRAVQIAPEFGPAWAIKGRAEALSMRLDLAADSFKKAIAIAPGCAKAHEWFGLYYHLPVGDPKKAIGAINRALLLNPLDAATKASAALPYFLTQQYPQAKSQVEQAIKLDGSNKLANRLQQYSPVWESLFPPPAPYVELAKRDKPTLTRAQAVAKAEALLANLKSGPRVTALEFASLLASVGRNEDAADALEEGMKRQDGTVIWMESDPGLTAIRKTPEYRRVRQRFLSISPNLPPKTR